ncbi:putative Ig domain-containing protein [Ostreibacterium oceani]|uniref:Dystroglycan-type cadherin-like domain-containing protein n=1 Tax=Ostreibacterium oceani TaxID=2654998 RepID=A0A6N7EXP5_9GAMM|nr:putative Ig domain-containing protein [Ostreibacterium oceani]MPV86159.1 hypothetical protein [Ostreibacterium oceani]
MKLKSFFAILSLSLPFSSFAYELFELKVAVKADGVNAVEAIQLPIQAQGNTFPNNLLVTFQNNLSSDGKAIWRIDNNTGNDLANIQALNYVDLEIEEAQNTFFNETATLSALTLPDSPTIIADYSPQPANQWMADEPGYNGGTLLGAYDSFNLSDANEQGATAEDIAVLFQHDITEVKAGDAFYIEVRVSESETDKGIKQVDEASTQNYYINSIAYVKGALSLIPPVVTITAPTTLSTTNITDTTIKVTDDVGILVADVIIDSGTTAGYSGFNCTQTSPTEVDCIVTITSTGDLVVKGTDSDSLSDTDSESYNITAAATNPPVVIITAPTTNSTTEITDSTIKVTDDVGVLVADVIVESTTTTGYRDFACVQTSPTEVDCTITITSSGNLIVKGIDSDGLIDSDTARYIIGASGSTRVQKIPASSLWGLIAITVIMVFVSMKNVRMRSKFISLVLVLLLATTLFPNSANAESIDNRGKDFWVSFMKNYNNAGVAKLFAASAENGSVTVEVAALDFKETFGLIGGSVTPIILPDEVMLDGAGIKFEMGIHVTSDVDISLYGISQLQFTTDAFQAIPVPKLGTEYFMAGYTKNGSFPPEFAIIATEDDTVVDFEFNELSKLNGENPTFTQRLNKGDIYYFEYAVEDITGTKIISDKPVSVFSGNNCVNIPRDRWACDHIVEQVPDITRWGKDFLLAPLALRKNGDTIRVLAQADDTKLYVNYSHLYTLSKGEYYEFIANKASYIKTSKPSLVMQYANSQQFDGVQADPFMMLVTPVNQYTNDYLIATPSGSFADDEGGKNFINVIVRDSDKGSVLLNGQSVDSTLFKPVENTEYVYAQLPISDAQHTLTADIAFGASVYGFSTFESYGYPGGSSYLNSDVTVNPESCLSHLNIRNKPGKIQVLWPNADAAKYQITRSSSYDGTFSQVAENASDVLTFLDKDVLDQTNYFYQVTQLDSLGIPRCRSAKIVGYPPNFGKSFNLAPIITSTPPNDTQVRTPFTYQMSVNDVENSALTYELLASPDESAALNANGLLSWQPETPGEYLFALLVTDADGAKALQEFILEVYDPNRPPMITSSPVLSAMSSERYQYQVIATDPDSDALTYSMKASNNAIKIAETTGLITWDVPPSTQGAYPIEITVTDANGASVKQNYSLYINKDLPPRYTSTIVREGTTGVPYVYRITATDPEGAKVKFFFPYGAPEGMAIDANTGEINWSNPIAGTYTVTVIATDGVNNVPQSFNLTITNPTDETLTITSTPETRWTAAESYSYQVTVENAFNAPTYSLIVRNDATPIRIDESSGLVTWDYPITGSYQIQITVNDGKNIVTQNYSLSVSRSEIATNKLPPEITSTPATIHKIGTQYNYSIRAIDPEGQRLTYGLVSGPEGMNISGQNIYWRTPLKGDHLIEIKVSDGGFDVTQSYTLTVIEEQTENQPPEFADFPTGTTIEPNQPFSYQVMATDADNDSLTYYFNGGNAPSGMTINSSTGLISWSGNDEITQYRVQVAVSDGKSIVYKSFNLYIRATNKFPIFDSRPTIAIAEGDTWRYDADATDPEGETVTYFFDGEVPAGMTINSITGVVEWPNVTGGMHSVTIVATDGVNQTKQRVRLTVGSGKGSAPEITSEPMTIGKVGDAYVYQVVANDDDGNTLTYSLLQAPSGMTIDSVGGLVSWETPQSGTYTVTISVYDGFYRVTQSYTLVINAVDGNQPPVITSTYPSAVMAGNIYSYQVQATDPDDDLLSYRLENAPAGMAVNAGGLVSWQTAAGDVGNYEITIIVSDGVSETRQTIYVEIRERVEISEELKKAVAWLKTQQQADGTVTSDTTIATPYQTTDEAFRAAELIGESFLDREIRSYLANADIDTTEHIARRALYQVENNVPYTNSINRVWARYIDSATVQKNVAGYTDFDNGDVNIVDTAYALLAQAKTSKKNDQVQGAVNYLRSQQNNDGSFGMPNNQPDMYVTSIALRALVAYKNTYALNNEITLARNYLMQNYNSIRNSVHQFWQKPHVLLTLYDALPDKAVLASQVDELKSRQHRIGYWLNQEPFGTALAIQAIYKFEQ